MKNMGDFYFKGKKVIVRVDFNAPQNEQHRVMDKTRIYGVKPTVDRIISDGGSVILITHLGRPNGKPDDHFSLRHILPDVSEALGIDVRFVSDTIWEHAKKAVKNMESGDVLLLENLRFSSWEESGNIDFAESLANLGDFYINDAFGAAHRAHASITTITRFFPNAKCFGFLMQKEIASIRKILNEGEHPVTAIIGWAKISTKMPIIENILPKIDNLIIGGGMAYTFIAAKWGKIGDSLCEIEQLGLARSIIQKIKDQNITLYLPKDSVVTTEFRNEWEKKTVFSDNIEDGWMALDIWDIAREEFREVILSSRMILWNGPLGVFELPNFALWTQKIGDTIRETKKFWTFSLVGGWDSVAFVKQYGYEDAVSYVSTGGGAMIEFLEGKTLPGIDAIQD